MAIVRVDEVLDKALSSDATAKARYNIKLPDGNYLGENVTLELTNPILQPGTPISAGVLNEMLSASGITGGKNTAYTLAQDKFSLFDGAFVRFKFHVATGASPTLNINGTGPKPIYTSRGAAIPSNIPANIWIEAIYNSDVDAYVLTNGGALLLSKTVLLSAAASVNVPVPSGYSIYKLSVLCPTVGAALAVYSNPAMSGAYIAGYDAKNASNKYYAAKTGVFAPGTDGIHYNMAFAELTFEKVGTGWAVHGIMGNRGAFAAVTANISSEISMIIVRPDAAGSTMSAGSTIALEGIG